MTTILVSKEVDRIVYNLQPGNYYIKISPIEIEHNGYEIENKIFEILSESEIKDSVVEYIYSSTSKKTNINIILEKENYNIDYYDWYRTNCENWCGFEEEFRILITRGYENHRTLSDITNLSILDYESYIKNIITVVYKAHKEYNFVHGDLLLQNVLCDYKSLKDKIYKIKIFDFNLSSINNEHSTDQYNFDNAILYLPLTGKEGFILDFYRLCICVLHASSRFSDTYIFMSDYIMMELLGVMKRCEYSFNDLSKFDCWVSRLEKTTNELYDHIVENYVLKSDSTETDDSV